jgi:hypothetical protein
VQISSSSLYSGREGLFIPPAVVSIDLQTALISAQRVSRIKFDKLLLAHQSEPILEDGHGAVEKVVTDNLKKLKKEIR